MMGLAAVLASGLAIPETPRLILPRPAIVRAESLELSRHMLLGMPLTMGMLARRMSPLTASFCATDFDNADLSSYSFSGQSIGAADASRYVVVLAASRNTSAISLSSITVAGQATTVLYTSGSSTDARAIAITSAPVTSGTTATVAVNWSGTSLRTGIGVYSVTGGFPVLVASYGANGSVSTATGGCVIAGSYNSASGTLPTFSGVTRNGTITLEGPNGMSVGSANVTTGGSLSVSAAGGNTFIASLRP